MPSENKNGLFGKDFLKTWYLADEEVKAVAKTAGYIKKLWESGASPRFFNGGNALLITNSGREPGMELAAEFGCGIAGLALSKKSGSDFSNSATLTTLLAAGCADVIALRDCEYTGKSSGYMRRLAACVKESCAGGRKPCVINLGSDEDSPVQTVSDLEYLGERFGGLEELAGRKIAVTWAYSPSCTTPAAVPGGIISLFTRFGADVVVANPEGFDLSPEAYERAQENAKASGGSFARMSTMAEAFEHADAVYPINWAPYAFLEKRTELCEAHRAASIELLESDLREQSEEYKDWECTEEMLEHANEGAVLMHSLPAQVTDVSCVRGEMTAQVYNANLSTLSAQAANRAFVFAAMALLSCSKEPEAVLKALEEAKTARI